MTDALNDHLETTNNTLMTSRRTFLHTTALTGVAATIAPTAMAPTVLSLHIFVMVAFTLVLFAMTYDYDGKSELSRIEGVALLVAFIAYDTYVVLQNVTMHD